ncbi:MAG: V-type ATP synthase subunit E [Conexivisphaera sp.]
MSQAAQGEGGERRASVIDDVLDLEGKRLDEMISSLESEAVERVRRFEEATLRELENLQRDYSARTEAARARLLGMAEIRARGEALSLIDEKSEEVLREAMSRIAAMPRDSDYEKVMLSLLREAADAVGSQELVVRVARPDAALAKKIISRASRTKRFRGVSLKLSDEVVESVGGLIVSSADGRVSYDNTFEARLARYRETIKSTILGKLKGEVR